MRLRPFISLSVVAVSAVLLTGCAGGGGNEASPSASASETPTSSACGLDPQPGADSDAITTSGDAPELTATVPTDLAFTELERTTVSAGEGADIAAGQLISGQYIVVDPSTGEPVMDSASTSADDSGLVPIIVDSNSTVGSAILCSPLGSTTALTIPGTLLSSGASNIVIIAQTVDSLPTTATGAAQEPVAGMPTVVLDADGAPTITIPDTDAPTELQIADLKKGDGATVNSGDAVSVQYTGVKWSDGTEFDSSWSRGVPAQFSTTAVVEGFQTALEGQQVGSQVLAVIPPALGYGNDEGNELQTETLVFVIDILGTQRAATQ